MSVCEEGEGGGEGGSETGRKKGNRTGWLRHLPIVLQFATCGRCNEGREANRDLHGGELTKLV